MLNGEFVDVDVNSFNNTLYDLYSAAADMPGVIVCEAALGIPVKSLIHESLQAPLFGGLRGIGLDKMQ